MSGPLLTRFAAALPFALDEFQQRACEAVEAGRGVLVAAPTGAGKTLVGEFAVSAALAQGRKAFYTTPIKALSNQKYADLARAHGTHRVGLLTGDASVNGEAPVVVMTTEVLRNMLYAGSPTLSGLGVVVMDEVHYLADRFRGAVWEEVIIHLPDDVLVVSLSATVSNAEEFGEWLTSVRGAVDVVVSEQRPVPLWQQMLVGRTLYDLFETPPDAGAPLEVNRELLARIRAEERPASVAETRRRGDPRRAGPRGRGGVSASRAEVVVTLDRAGLLPAITFVFSRQGCEAAVSQLLATALRLVSEEQGAANRRFLESRVADLSDADLAVLGYWDLADGVSRGFAAHHAGMLPTFREVVEALFTAGRLRAVFATETLALGINMPARTVVLERLVKFNGQTHADVTPAEYTQLTGRAGRRGIDVEGYAVVLWRRGLDPRAVAGLASTRTYPLRSSFAPTYNMAVNLVASVGRQTARTVLESSFAQFQADRAVVGLARMIARNERAMGEDAERMTCERGDFAEYAALREQLGRLEKDRAKARAGAQRADAEASLARLRVGDVIRVPAGRRAGHAVVVAAASGQRPVARVVTEDKRLRRLTAADLPAAVEPLATVRIPRGFDPRSPRSRRDLAARLRTSVAGRPAPESRSRPAPAVDDDERVAELRRRLRAHPCHRCPDRDEHARWAQRWWRLRRETDRLRRQVDGRTGSVARTFERICAVLTELGYLAPTGTAVTSAGERLRTLYTEKDLLAAEALRLGLWDRLDAAGLAAVVSTLVHEPRRDEEESAIEALPAEVSAAVEAMERLQERLESLERAHDLAPSAAPSTGIAALVHRWASGRPLQTVLRGSPVAAGDFVRRCKQVVDVLGQVADSAPDPALAATAHRAVRAVLRGVVAADRLD